MSLGYLRHFLENLIENVHNVFITGHREVIQRIWMQYTSAKLLHVLLCKCKEKEKEKQENKLILNTQKIVWAIIWHNVILLIVVYLLFPGKFWFKVMFWSLDIKLQQTFLTKMKLQTLLSRVKLKEMIQFSQWVILTWISYTNQEFNYQVFVTVSFQTLMTKF